MTRFWLMAGIYAVGLAACTPGYMKASDLEAKQQGPSHCAARCEELGMRMGALVLVADDLPGCVCQPKFPLDDASKGAPEHAPKPAPSSVPQTTPGSVPEAAPPAPETTPLAAAGASAAVPSYAVVLASAVAARKQQHQQMVQRKQQQQNYLRQ